MSIRCLGHQFNLLGSIMSQAHMAARVEASKTAGGLAPRFDRLVARLATSPKETAALRFVLHKQVAAGPGNRWKQWAHVLGCTTWARGKML